MTFSLIAGQTEAKSALRQMAQSGRAPHALMICGPTGAGSLALGVSVARALLCARLSPGGDPCESCNSCRKTARYIHPDLHFSFPTVGANSLSSESLPLWRQALADNPLMAPARWLQILGAENKQGNITRNECQSILQKLSLTSVEGRAKVLLMWLPEYLGKEGNRLLKMIEEPPENTYFILICEQLEAVLPTVLSRCQLVRAPLLSDEEVRGYLQERLHLGPEQAARIAFLAEGDLNRAIELTQNESQDNSEQLLDWLRKCWRGYGPDLVKWTEQFAAMGKENQKQFFAYGLHFLRELLILRNAPDSAVRLQESERLTATNVNKVLDLEKIAQIARIFDQNLYYAERNANLKIMLMNTSIKVHQLLKS